MIFEESVVVGLPFDDALTQVKQELADEGFGTITEIDLQATLAAKTGKEMGRYTIIGACNPHLAGRALDAEPQIGVLLPCNVVVRESTDGVVVEAMDPGMMATITGNEAVRPVADEARRLIGRALQRLAGAG
jgi:uncharacterized protein (DUF302 family)